MHLYCSVHNLKCLGGGGLNAPPLPPVHPCKENMVRGRLKHKCLFYTLAFFFLTTTPVALLVTGGCLTEPEEEEGGGATPTVAADDEDVPIVIAVGIDEWEE